MKRSDPKNKYKHRRMRLVKAKAKELMLAGENHLLLIFSSIVIGVTLIIPQFIFGMVYGFFTYPLADVAIIVCEFFLISPLAFGLLRVVKRMADGEKCVIADLFEAFYSAETYFRSLAFGLMLTLVAVVDVLLLSIPIGVGEWMIGLSVDMWISDAVSIVGFWAMFAFVLVINCRLSLFPMLVARGEGVFRALTRSFSLSKGRTFRLIGYELSFLPLVLVSIAAVLVPMLIYTAPYMLCAYAIGVKMICENNNE